MDFCRLLARCAGVLAGLLLTLACAAADGGAKAYVGNFKDNTVSVIDLARSSVIGTIPVAAGPHGMVISADGGTVWISGDGSSQVSVIDTTVDRVRHTLEVGRTPHGLALLPRGDRLLVAVYGEDRVAAFDTASGQPLGSVAVARPHTIAVHPDGRRAYVASQAPGHFALAVIDLATMALLRELPLDKPPRDLEFAFDGRALYFTTAGDNAVQVLDPRTDQVIGRIPTGASPHIASLFRGAAAGTVVVQGPGELTLFDADSLAVLRSIPVGRQPHWAAAGAGGSPVLVTNEGSDDISIVDLASGHTRTLAVGHAPRKVVVQPRPAAANAAPGGARVSIADFRFTPQQIVIAPGQSVTWANDDGAPHGLAFADGAGGTDLLLPGDSARRRFDQPGSYDYVCSVHAYMAGQVIVRGP